MKTKVEISQWEASEIVRYLTRYHFMLDILTQDTITDEDLKFMKKWSKQKHHVGTRIDATMGKLFAAMEIDGNKLANEEIPH